MKKNKFFVAALFSVAFLSMVACGSNKNSNKVDSGIHEIYQLYLNQGGDLTYEEWLKSIKGEKGDTGPAGADGTSLLTGNGAPSADQGKTGDSYIDLSNWDFFIKENSGWVLKGNIKAQGDNPQGLEFYLTDNDTYYVSHGTSKMLSNIVIPSTYNGRSVEGILYEGFLNNDPEDSRLVSITIPNSIKTIGKYAFYGCSSLTTINIPEGVTLIDDYTFYGCHSLSSITIPNSVTSIGPNAFASCSSLTSITIPNSVTSIGVATFDHCSSLTSITIPNSVTSIGSDAFANCSSLTSIIIPNGITSIGSYTFANCSSLTSITIPNSVTSIGSNAFNRCSGLQSIIFNGTCSEWESVEKEGEWNWNSSIATIICTDGTITL